MTRFRTLFAALFLAAIISSPILADPVLSVVPASVSNVNVGSTISYDINISNVTDLYAFQFDLTFNPAIVSAVSIAEGSFLSSPCGSTCFVPGVIDNLGGTIAGNAGTLIGPPPGVTGSGTLAILTLQGVAAGSSSIGLVNALLLDSTPSPISNVSLQSGSVTVNGTVATPEPGSLLLLFVGMAASIFCGLFFRK
jgi:general secretion pathway protein D